MEAPVATQLAVGAAIFRWVGAVFMVVGVMSASHSSEISDKYPGLEAFAVIQDFNHSDCVLLIKDRFVTMEGLQAWVVLNGLCESIAAILALCAIMCLKTQITWSHPSPDEVELIMFGSLCLGLVIPMLEFSLRTGPMSLVAWYGSRAAGVHDGGPNDEGVGTGWSDDHFKLLFLTIQIVESLFFWINNFAFLLLGVGFLLLSSISKARASLVIYVSPQALPP